MRYGRVVLLALVAAFFVAAGLVGPVPVSAQAGDAIVRIRVEVNEEGQVTGKTVTPGVACIKGASRDGVPDGGCIYWHMTANQRVAPVTVRIKYDFPEGSPFEKGDTIEAQDIALNPDLPNIYDLGRAKRKSGDFRFRVEGQQDGRIVLGGGVTEVRETCAVGGMVELPVGGPDSAVDSAAGLSSGSSSVPYVALAAASAAGAIALTAGAWYARRRWVR